MVPIKSSGARLTMTAPANERATMVADSFFAEVHDLVVQGQLVFNGVVAYRHWPAAHTAYTYGPR